MEVSKLLFIINYYFICSKLDWRLGMQILLDHYYYYEDIFLSIERYVKAKHVIFLSTYTSMYTTAHSNWIAQFFGFMQDDFVFHFDLPNPYHFK